MKMSRKLEQKNAARVAAYDSKMDDSRISSTFKQSSNRPGSDKRKK